jgi:hypothetical protein
MKRPYPTAQRVIALALAGFLLAGCTGPQRPLMNVTPKEGVIKRTPIARTQAPAQLHPLPTAKTSSFTATTAGGVLGGTAALAALSEPYFQNSAAPYRVAATTLGNAMVTLSTLQEDLFTKDGSVINGLTDLTGAFSLNGLAPKDKPYVVNVNFVQSHRLSALVVPDGSGNASGVKVDEASTMIAETARWQLRDIPTNQAGLLASVYSATSALLADVGLVTDDGTIPNVEALKLGAGHVLRNAYVETFGSLIGEGTAGDANANTLSDAWQTLLGFRPLALTRVVGNGTKSFDQGDGRVAAEAPLGGVQDAAEDHLGNLYLAEHDNGLLRFVPKTDQGAMAAGKIYTLAGQINTGSDLASFNDIYANTTPGGTNVEAASVADPSAAPLLSAGYPLIRPRKLLVQRVGATADSHVFVLSKFGQRVFFIPATDVTVFGRPFLAGRLYTVLGNGQVGDPAAPAADGTPGHAFALNEPTAMAQDSAGNLYVLDSIAGAVRLVRAGDGSVVTLPLKVDATTAYAAVGAQDLRVVEGASNFLYLADTNAHTVVRFPLPADLADLDGAVSDMTAQTVFGVAGEPGYIKAGLTYPDIHDASKALSEADARLNEPTSLTFDGAGNMIVAAKGRLHLMEASALDPATVGNTYVIAGGVDTRNIVGDSRLGYFPATTSVRYDATSKNVLVVDNAENVVRRLWTARGTL